MHHMQESHLKEFEAMSKKGKSISAGSITGNFASKKEEAVLGIKDVKRVCVVAETEWTI